MIKEQKGITLIALVITIIVLLILAGVSIAMLTGENGILNQAVKAGDNTKVAEAKEVAGLDVNDKIASYYKSKYTSSTPTTEANAGAYVKASLTTSTDSTKYTISGEGETYKITIVPKTNSGKTVTGTIGEDGKITWDPATLD